MRIRAVLALALALAGCSAARLLYPQADHYLKWKANSYLALDGAQEDELMRRVQDFMAWHRASALPQYARLAEDAARRVERGLSRADLVWGYDSALAQIRESIRAAAERIAPLLDRMTPGQIAHLERELAEDDRRFARKYLRGGEAERRQQRFERNVERLEDWVGRLSEAQRSRVAEYVRRAPALEELRRRDRRRLHAELLAMVRAGEARKRLPEAAVHWERGREPAYAAAYEAARREYFDMLLDLERSLSPEQRRRAVRALSRWARDFRTLAAP